MQQHLEDLIDLTDDSAVAAWRNREQQRTEQEADTLIEVSPTCSWLEAP